MLEDMINLNIRKLFNCIKENQFDINGKLIPTIITVKEDLIKRQESGTFDPKESNTNYVLGEIVSVGENYVVILADNPCSKQIIYTLFYSKIVYISSFVIEKIDLNKCLQLDYELNKIKLEKIMILLKQLN